MCERNYRSGADSVVFVSQNRNNDADFASRIFNILLEKPLEQVVKHSLVIGGDAQEITCTSMGNPHCSLFAPTLEGVRIDELGPLLEDHPVFPVRTNDEFAHVISREEIEVLFWERGVVERFRPAQAPAALP